MTVTQDLNCNISIDNLSTDLCESSSVKRVISTDPSLSQAMISADPSLSQAMISTDPSLSQAMISTDPSLSQAMISADPSLSQAMSHSIKSFNKHTMYLASAVATLTDFSHSVYNFAQNFTSNPVLCLMQTAEGGENCSD